ncbi:helix-turn-helix domain-containing protein [Brevundimonas sp.]|uniref:helix-turn-helix domain-containing protein n=1 Tax=Brevundimonas sp. TaxID=1871086 RepID=UPI003AFFC645
MTSASELLTIQAAADFLRVHRSFLDRRRVAGGGPQYIRMSARVIRYAAEDLERWLETNRRVNTSQAVED